MKTEWPNDMVSGIRWVTPLQHWELALTFIAYGNEAASETRYSAAAILVVIPPWSPERGQVDGDGEATFSVEHSSNEGSQKGRRPNAEVDGYRGDFGSDSKDDDKDEDYVERDDRDAVSPPGTTAAFSDSNEDECEYRDVNEDEEDD